MLLEFLLKLRRKDSGLRTGGRKVDQALIEEEVVTAELSCARTWTRVRLLVSAGIWQS